MRSSAKCCADVAMLCGDDGTRRFAQRDTAPISRHGSGGFSVDAGADVQLAAATLLDSLGVVRPTVAR